MTKLELQKTLGENLRKARQLRKFSINELAGKMGITPGYLGLIEHGKRGLTPFMMFKASELLDIPISMFFGQRSLESLI